MTNQLLTEYKSEEKLSKENNKVFATSIHSKKFKKCYINKVNLINTLMKKIILGPKFFTKVTKARKKII